MIDYVSLSCKLIIHQVVIPINTNRRQRIFWVRKPQHPNSFFPFMASEPQDRRPRQKKDPTPMALWCRFLKETPHWACVNLLLNLTVRTIHCRGVSQSQPWKYLTWKFHHIWLCSKTYCPCLSSRQTINKTIKPKISSMEKEGQTCRPVA